ncbi:hypothetical protein Pint_14376 [Pistacia integerrima]|uniref:Uncharacterized protein n=1 Tax=Pistacia integerrima TaxID=434235 RepID=A0ACC0YAY6_9ROSI|nr:hypothetical protein Pint_14376 [Pistacia integerrima]
MCTATCRQLSLLRNGDKFLTDAGGILVWNAKTQSDFPVQSVLLDSGNLVLSTHQRQLVSSRSEDNISSGVYKFYFDNNNVLRLLYDAPETSTVYWPNPDMLIWDTGRSTYDNRRTAVLDDFPNMLDSWPLRT